MRSQLPSILLPGTSLQVQHAGLLCSLFKVQQLLLEALQPGRGHNASQVNNRSVIADGHALSVRLVSAHR